MTVFETTTCSRCGGSGSYSFNLMDGDRCYGCSGTGQKLTKRGAAARAFFVASQEMPVAELRVGMFLWDNTFGARAKFLPILSIAPTSGGQLINGAVQPSVVISTSRSGLVVWAEGTVRAVRDEAHRKALVEAALAFQATLTQAGKPSKRKGA